MGKIRVKTIGDEEAEKKQQEELKKKKEARIAEAKAAAKDSAEEAEVSIEEPKTGEKTEETIKKEVKSAPKGQATTQKRSKSYNSVAVEVDKTKNYAVSEALSLLPKLKRAKFDETVELHLTFTEKASSVQVTLPHGTGKNVKVAIATDDVIKNIESGKIDFDVLLAEPASMPKLAKVAKVLGPKGLMPNPKNGTVTPNPAEAVKKFQAGQVTLKQEAKNPIMHVVVGKSSFGEKKLEDNINAVLGAVKKTPIKKAVLSSTMSPGIKLSL